MPRRENLFRYGLISLLGLALLLPGLASAQSLATQVEKEILNNWRVRKEVLHVGQDPLGTKQLDAIKRIMKRHGLRGLPSVSLALVQEILDADEKTPITEDPRFEYARDFSPNLPALDYILCRNSQSHIGLSRAIGSCISGLQLELDQSVGKFRWLTNLFLYAWHVYLVLALIFLVFLLATYTGPVTRYLGQVSRGFRQEMLIGLLLLLLVIAFLLGSWPAVCMLSLFLFWRFLPFGEKAIAFVLVLFGALLPLSLHLPALHLEHQKEVTSLLERPYEGMFVQQRIGQLENWMKEHPQDELALFTLGRLHKELRNYEQARSYFKKAIDARPKWHKPVVGLALIDYIEGSLPQAVLRLQKATSLAPRSALAHFNLSKILLKETRLEEGQAELMKAKEIDPDRFAQLNRASNPNDHSEFLVDEELSQAEVSSRVWKPLGATESLRNQLLKDRFPTLSIRSYWLLLIGGIILCTLLGTLWPGPAASEIREESDQKNRQIGYLDVFDVNGSTQPPKQGRAWKSVQRQWSTLFIPGYHHLFLGNYGKASFWILLSVALITPLLFARCFLTEPNSTPFASSFLFFNLGMTSFVGVYVYLVWDSLRQ